MFGLFGNPSGNIIKQYEQLPDLFRQGLSWEEMSKRTGMPVRNIRQYSEAKYPGYGIRGDEPRQENDRAAANDAPQSAPQNNPSWQSFTGGGWGGGGGGGQASRDKANAIAAYDEEIRQANDALGRLGTQQSIGESNAAKARDRAFTENENSFNQARGMYDMNTRDAIDRIKKTRDQVESDAADKIRSARGVFAAGGAADSSFAKILAPFMIGKEASKQQGQAQDTYARNRREMDINYAATENAYKKNKRDIQGEYDNRINGIRQKIQGTRSDLEDRIRRANINKGVANGSSLAAAQASQREAADRISGYGREIDQLSADRSIPVEKVEWRAPKLDSYETRDVAVKPENAENGAVNDQIAPNLQPLLDTDEKKKKEAWGW